MDAARLILRRIADNPESRNHARNVLKLNHFIDKRHTKIFGSIVKLTSNGTKVVTEEMLLDNAVTFNWPMDYAEEIGAIFSGKPPLDSEFTYALDAIVSEARSMFVSKGLMRVAEHITRGDTQGAISLIEQMPEFYQRLAIASDRRESSRTMRALEPDTGVERFKVGFQVFDAITYGGALGEFWLWAAYVGEMKSNALCAISHSLFLSGKRVLYVTLEMTAKEIKRRLLCQHAFHLGMPVAYRYLESGEADGVSENNIEKAKEDFDTNSSYGDIQIWNPPLGATIMDVAKEIEVCAAKEETDCEIVVLDYVQKLAMLSDKKDHRHALNETLDRAKKIAMEARNRKGVFMVSGYQTSSSGRQQAEKDGYYSLAALSETLGAGQIANVICWSLYTNAYRSRKEIKVGLAKARNASIDGSMHFLPVDPAIGMFARSPVCVSDDSSVESLDGL